MGTLVVKTYPTTLFLKLADHTYVECGTGRKAWKCWGGNTGGQVLRSGTGSTNRANEIAQPDEKANIRCYLINGVCHQAANRILLPADILVRGARGYAVSHALFGTYGRVGIWPCSSPFEQYPDVTGDLPECMAAAPAAEAAATGSSDREFIRGQLEIYRGMTEMMLSGAGPADAMGFQLELFMHMAEFHLGPLFSEPLARDLRQVRMKIEAERTEPETTFTKKEMSARDFVEWFNDLTVRFQTDMANVMKANQYEALFELTPEEQVMLADPEIVEREYGL